MCLTNSLFSFLPLLNSLTETIQGPGLSKAEPAATGFKQCFYLRARVKTSHSRTNELNLAVTPLHIVTGLPVPQGGI